MACTIQKTARLLPRSQHGNPGLSLYKKRTKPISPTSKCKKAHNEDEKQRQIERNEN
ncbi:7310_t:CDS:2 [Rhizophagus irregularis]|nr:7310_t:CDS:2 [Rhizophagus irregularis]